MALTHCNHCGKPISDTIETCIHCGNPITLLKDENKKSQEVDLFPYTHLSKEERIKCEETFIRQNKRAFKFYRAHREISKFKRLSLLIVIIASLVYLICGIIYLSPSKIVRNSTMLEAGLILDLLLVVFGLILGVYSLIKAIIHKFTLKIFLYEKAFQSWLKNSCAISYEPPFSSEKDKAKFELICKSPNQYF